MTQTSTGRAHYPLRRTAGAAALVLLCLLPARAQQGELTPPKVEVKATFGAAGFGEELDTPHVVAGGSARFYLTRRFSVEPELLYMRNGPDDQDYLFTPNVAYDLSDPTKGVVPYVAGGVGVFHHRGRFFGNDFDTGQPRVFDTSSTTWAVTAGGGVKIFLSDRLFIAPDARLGYVRSEPTVRGTVSLGYVLSGRSR
jgi:opacity protein-like surface antigen